MRFLKKILCSFLLVVVAGCGGPGRYDAFYTPVMKAPISNANAYLLDAGAAPRMIYTESFEDDLKTFTDQNFIIVGESVFSAPMEDTGDALELGKEMGITHVLLSVDFAYSGSKKAHKYYSDYDYARKPMPTYVNGYAQYGYERIPTHRSIPYRKKVDIFKQRATFLVKLK